MKWQSCAIALSSTLLLPLLTQEPGRTIVAVDEDALLRQISLPGEFSGVVSLEGSLTGDAPTPFCTGSLLTGGQYILTAAHCLTDENTTTIVSGLLNQPFAATFDLASGFTQVLISDLFVFPGWQGSVLNGGDIALLRLLEPAPAEAEQYDIYRNTDELGQSFLKVGYGDIGTGTTGDILPNGLFAFFGQNQFEATEADFVDLLFNPPTTVSPLSQLLYDFDSGFPIDNLFGSLGLGSLEVNTGFGDSGGPAFIGNRIAGLTSYGIGGFGLTFPSDIDTETNSTFGELSGDTRVSTYASFVDAVLAGRIAPSGQNTAAIPEPSTLAGMALFGAWLLNRRRSQPGDR